MSARSIFCLIIVSAVVVSARPAVAISPGDATVNASTEVLQDLLKVPEQGIPAALLGQAHGVAIIPNTIKVGLVIGGQKGKGVLVVREKDGGWRAPTFITLKGGSVGLQLGAQGSDIVLVFKTQKSVDGLLKGTFKIGADASAAAGPVGRSVEAATNAQLKAEIYSYSRSRGLFAGLSIDGSVIEVDGVANAAYYGTVAEGQIVPPAALKLVEMIAQVAAHQPLPAGQPVGQPVGQAMVAGDPAGPAFPQPAMPAPQPAPAAAAADIARQQLARGVTQLSARLDPTWRQYLAVPAEIYGAGNHPSVADLRNAQARYDAITTDPRYAALNQLPEFQAARNLLHGYIGALSALQPTLNLPPPPAVVQ